MDVGHDESPLWHGQAHMPTVKTSRRVIVRGEGAHVWDEHGQRVLDLPASLWYCNVGHGRSEIADAVSQQMRSLAAYSNFQRFVTPPALELAERLVVDAPVADAKVFLTSGGSDAVDLAVKLARRYWSAVGRPEKRVIVSRERSYHGLHGFGTSVCGLSPNRDGLGSLLPDVTRVPHDDWRELERLFVDGGADRIAAFFCEPIIGSGGVLHPPSDYLRNVQRLCRDYDVLFVVDEVITGFGRVGERFASDRFDLRPDLLLFAKGVTSGYMPLGGALIAGWVAEPFWADDTDLVLRHGLTYQAHASACAAALANLDVLEREGLIDRARRLETVLASALRPLEDVQGVVEVRVGAGLLAGVVLPDALTALAVSDLCWSRGLLVRQIGDGEVLHLSPPFVISEAELQWAGTELAGAIREVADGAMATAGGGR